jgi:hypothetical protein
VRLDHLLSKEKRFLLFSFESSFLCEHSIKVGGIAQLGEHLPCTQGVKSSNLFISTILIKLKLHLENYTVNNKKNN